MKKLLALIVALMLALSCVALAEPGTAYYVSFIDPVVYQNEETLLDATGLELTLGALVSDAGTAAVQAFANVGENYDIPALSAQAQVDGNGLTFLLDGLENIYSIDLSEYTGGMDLTSMLGLVPLNTVLNAPVETEDLNVDLTRPVRYAMATSMLEPYMNGSAITIDRAQGEQILDEVLAALEEAVASANIEDLDAGDIAELRAMKPAFDFSGELTITGKPEEGPGTFTVEGTGKFYAEDLEEGLPFTLTYADKAFNITLDVVLGGEEYGETIEFVADAVKAQDATQAVTADAALLVSGEEQISMTFSATPTVGSKRVDYVLSLNLPTEETSMSLLVSTGTYPEGIGFGIDLFIETPEESVNPYIYYNGEKNVDEIGVDIAGSLLIGAVVDGMDVGLDTYLVLQKVASDTSEWAYDSTGAIAIESLDENQTNALSAGLMGVVGNAVTVIMENVPGLASIFESLVG